MYYFYRILHNHLLFQSAFQQLLFCADSHGKHHIATALWYVIERILNMNLRFICALFSLRETHSGTKFAAPAKQLAQLIKYRCVYMVCLRIVIIETHNSRTYNGYAKCNEHTDIYSNFLISISSYYNNLEGILQPFKNL